MQQRDSAQRKSLPAAETFTKALQKKAEEAPMLVHMPGPLELNHLPFIKWEQLPEQFCAGLNERASELTAVLNDSSRCKTRSRER